MARSLNKVQLIGHLGKDPELKTFANGGQVTNVSIATSESWKDKDGQQQERTEWTNLVFNGKLAEIADEYLRKGSKVFVEGSLRTRSWEKDGQTRYVTEVYVRDLIMLDGKPDGQRNEPSREREQNRRPAQQSTGHQGGGGFVDDDIPFAPRHWNEG